MFKIEDLINLFPNEEVKKLLVYSYYLSQEKDKKLSNSLFSQLLFLKKTNPEIDIIIDESIDNSFYNSYENVIYLKNTSIDTFFHELTHLLSNNYSNFDIPKEFNDFRNYFFSNKENESLVIDFLELCHRKKEQYIQKIDINKIEQSQIGNNNQDPFVIESDLISTMEDIIDSIYDGRSFTQGLRVIKDNTTNVIKAKKTAGHGCEYFSESNLQFEEILANYLALKLTDPDNELFLYLKEILGKEFVGFLEQRCSEICGDIPKIDINNNISKNNI